MTNLYNLKASRMYMRCYMNQGLTPGREPGRFSLLLLHVRFSGDDACEGVIRSDWHVLLPSRIFVILTPFIQRMNSLRLL